MCNVKNCGKGCCGSMVGKVLLIIGGLNWGLVGVGMLADINLNIIDTLLGAWPMVEGIVYVLVGLAAIMNIFGCRCAKCKATCSSCDHSVHEGKMQDKI